MDREIGRANEMERKMAQMRRALDREKRARKVAEKLLEDKASQLYSINEHLARKNENLERMNRDLMDSIRYAKRIQEAIMPSTQWSNGLLDESFIFFRPRDLVSGDFYWMEEIGDTIYFAAGDCTGHGVPGAFMSILGLNGLMKSVHEASLRQPGEILNYLDDYLVGTLNKKKNRDVRDGIDISLCKLDRREGVLEYSGAYNPLYFVRDGQLQEVRADRKSVGSIIDCYGQPSYTNNMLKVNEGDTFYIFSDGFPDQFGGPKGKKFKYGPFKNLLLDISNTSMDKQEEILDISLESWKGGLQQIDDILVIGARV